jgi:hypothetical protein
VLIDQTVNRISAAAAGGVRLALTALALGCMALGPAWAAEISPSATIDTDSQARPEDRPKRADFLAEPASREARQVADGVTASDDNGALPFAIIDKVHAKVFVFDSRGRLRGATMALLGKGVGDDTVPGIGSRPLKTIRPEERTTPAGRFVAFIGRDLQRDVLWIDYDAAISMHRVVLGDPGDHRLQRLATPSTADKRISYGCINVPVKFYEDVVLQNFIGAGGIVYILPEIKSLADVFPSSVAGIKDRP